MNARAGLLSGAAIPRALSNAVVFAQGGSRSPEQILNQLNEDFKDFKDRYESALDSQATQIAALKLNGLPDVAGATDSRPPDPEYSKTFATWFRKGDDESKLKAANAEGYRQAVQAAMQSGSDGAGGYLAPVEWDRRVNKSLVPVSPMRRLARVIPTTTRAYSTLYSKDGWGSGWVGETAGRPATSNPSLDPLTFPHGEIYANPAVTQNLLDDADFDLQQWLADEVAEEFGKQEGIAFLAGDGVNKPRGFLTYVPGGASDAYHPGGNLAVVNSGAAAALGDSDRLIDFVYSLPAPYRQNARWLMNSTTAAVIAKMKDGDGRYLWRETYVQGQPATLLGYPVEIDEGMPAISASALPIAFGDFQRGYVINDRHGVRVLRDPFTNKPFVQFYTTKRVGGGVDDIKAIRLLKIAA